MARKLYIKVGDEAVRGPLSEDAVRASLESGVLDPSTTLAGESADALQPIANVLAGAAPQAAAPPRNRKAIALALVGLIGLCGVGASVAYWAKNRPPPLCKATPNILGSLTSDLQVTLYITPGAKKLDDARRRVEGLLGRMQEKSNGHLSYRVIEVPRDQGRVERRRGVTNREPVRSTARNERDPRDEEPPRLAERGGKSRRLPPDAHEGDGGALSRRTAAQVSRAVSLSAAMTAFC